MRNTLKAASSVVALLLIAAVAMPQDGLGKRRGGGDSGGNSGGQSHSGGGGGSRDRGGNDSGRSGGSSGGNRGSYDGGSRDSGSRDSGSRGGSGSFDVGGLFGRRTNREANDTRGRDSRSGNVHYGSDNNRVSKEPTFRVDRPRFDQSSTVLRRKVERDDARVNVVRRPVYHDGWRSGYVHYDRRWRDDYFWYPHYVFDPYSCDRFVYSPWYYYTFLPPYVSYTRVIIVDHYGSIDVSYQPYRWTIISDRGDRDYDRGDRPELDDAVTDLVDSFEDSDRRAVNRLIPRNGNVAIMMDGRYQYSLKPDDFYDLYMDGIENAKTNRYKIVDVRVHGDSAKVVARHEFTDSWGNRQAVYHKYRLEEERGKYVIREFDSSQDER